MERETFTDPDIQPNSQGFPAPQTLVLAATANSPYLRFRPHIRPLIDAAIVSFLVLGSFLLSALIVRAGGGSSQVASDSTLAPVAVIAVAVAGLVGFLVYTSRRKFHTAFQKLAEAEKRLRDVTDAAGEYIWEVDENGHYTFLSERVRDVLGYAPAELVGRHPFEFLVETSLGGVHSQSHVIVQNCKIFRDFEHQMKRKDGQLIWLSVNGVPVFGEGARFVGYRGAALDITPRKLAEQALIREKESAQSAAIAKSQFLAMMSHEIRTPLNSVLGFSDLLANSNLDTVQREHLEMIRKSGDGLLALLNDILEFSRADSESLIPKIEVTNIREFLQEVMALHRPLAKAKNLTLSVQVEESVPEWLGLDRARFRQILLNLAGNAVKFTTTGSVKVSASEGVRKPGSARFPLVIRVSDTGIGIPEDKRDLLFRPFSQVDSSATRKFGGTGLGLAICRKLASMLGGNVLLEKSSAAGSTFVLNCPCDPAESFRGSRPIRSAPHSPNPLPGRVLVAEDNPASRKLMQIMLSKLGLDLELASDGSEAVAKHTTTPFDLIFMDVQMPVMDGISATREIRELERLGKVSKRACIVALTANVLTEDREHCLKAGMDDYLSKPVNKESLAAMLAKHVAPPARQPPIA